MRQRMKAWMGMAWMALTVAVVSGCASGPPVRSQEYAKLSDQKTFEYDFPTVWKAITVATKDYKILSVNPAKVDNLELKKLDERTLETDWIYSQSRDKYQEYEINGTPRKQYLSLRVKYEIKARRVMGGVEVKVASEEEVQPLNEDGSPGSYEETTPDTSRLNELLSKIDLAILSAAP